MHGTPYLPGIRIIYSCVPKPTQRGRMGFEAVTQPAGNRPMHWQHGLLYQLNAGETTRYYAEATIASPGLGHLERQWEACSGLQKSNLHRQYVRKCAGSEMAGDAESNPRCALGPMELVDKDYAYDNLALGPCYYYRFYRLHLCWMTARLPRTRRRQARCFKTNTQAVPQSVV